ncbi:tRNA pseudouridine(55) synthase TruB [Microcella sp.]|uniref:tRNA pseudouridine(55) synthase TruB n=1 Tax=Microcella sp. TaxID=1913979 RepID=UPI0039196023
MLGRAGSVDAVISGLLFVDKPAGLTSHDVVARARRALGTRKVGHAGTLDPAATGLLTLGVGPATRLLTYLVGLDKQYTTTIHLGVGTTTDDAEGEPVGAPAPPEALAAATDERIAVEVAALTGELDQVPSSVSAIKVDGRRAYDRVRAGEEVELASRRVTVSRFEVLDVRRTAEAITVDAVVDCSSGTYIRALARDLGAALGVGGHLTALRRTRVGPFDVDDDATVTLDALVAAGENASAVALLTPPAEGAARLFPVLHTSAEQARDLSHGKKLDALDFADASPVAAVDAQGRLVALLSVERGRGRILTGFPQEP